MTKRNQPTQRESSAPEPIDELLSGCGFDCVSKRPAGGWSATGASDFCTAHDAALQAIGNRAHIYVFHTSSGPVLMVNPIEEF